MVALLRTRCFCWQNPFLCSRYSTVFKLRRQQNSIIEITFLPVIWAFKLKESICSNESRLSSTPTRSVWILLNARSLLRAILSSRSKKGSHTNSYLSEVSSDFSDSQSVTRILFSITMWLQCSDILLLKSSLGLIWYIVHSQVQKCFIVEVFSYIIQRSDVPCVNTASTNGKTGDLIIDDSSPTGFAEGVHQRVHNIVALLKTWYKYNKFENTIETLVLYCTY